MSVQTQIDRISGAVSAALTALTEKGVEVPAGTKVDGLAALIAAIEAGGGGSGGVESCTFTPAETGLVELEVKDWESIAAVFWYNTGNVQIGTSGESVAGFTFAYKSKKQYIATLYNDGSYTASFSGGVNHTNYAINAYTASMSTYYGCSMLRQNNNSALTFYVNTEGANGLRIGATYKAVIMRK